MREERTTLDAINLPLNLRGLVKPQPTESSVWWFATPVIILTVGYIIAAYHTKRALRIKRAPSREEQPQASSRKEGKGSQPDNAIEMTGVSSASSKEYGADDDFKVLNPLSGSRRLSSEATAGVVPTPFNDP